MLAARARDDIITLTHKKEGRILVSELVGYILILLLDPRRSHGSSGSPRRARLDPRAAGDVFIKAAVQVQQPLFFSLSICALAAAAPPAAAAPAFKCALIYARAMPRVAHFGEKGARPFCVGAPKGERIHVSLEAHTVFGAGGQGCFSARRQRTPRSRMGVPSGLGDSSTSKVRF